MNARLSTSSARIRVHPRSSAADVASRRRAAGVVLIVVLLSILLLAGLVMYVLRLGRSVNGRVVTQHAADASAAAGATWMARSFNTVALNNVGIAQLIATVPVLDAMPMATAFALEDQQALHDALQAHRARGINGAWVQDGVDVLLDQLLDEIDTLEPMDELFNRSGYDLREMTFYQGPAGRGQLWQSMHAMDEMSRTAMETLDTLAQVAAMDGGAVNLRGQGEGGGEDTLAMLVPVTLAVPYQRGGFDDFRRPVLEGLLPQGVDDTTTNRGPYDAVYGWRDYMGRQRIGHWENSDTQIAGGGRGSIPISSGSRGDPTGQFVQTGTTPPTAYRVFGPFTRLLRLTGDFSRSRLFHSRFSSYVATQADAKRRYLWPDGPAPQPGDPIVLENMVDPQWQTDYAQARTIAAAGSPRIHETAFAVVEIKSRYPQGHASFMTPGSWQYVTRQGRQGIRIARRNGFLDPAAWINPPRVTQVGQMAVREEWSYTVFYDLSIGLPPIIDAAGQSQPQTVYRIDDYFFLGVNIGDEVAIRDPFNFPSRSVLPTPIDFDHGLVRPEPAARRQYLTCLAVARRPVVGLTDRPGQPMPHMLAVAQSQVFNDHSFDLWTHTWATRLDPVTDLDDWADRLEQTAAGADLFPQLGAVRAGEVLQYLRAVGPLADVAMVH